MSRPRVLHVFKTAMPESAGGVQTAMSSIADGLAEQFDSRFLVASNKGDAFFARNASAPVSTVRHFGYFMSMPVAPTFPLRLKRFADKVDLVVLHSPFPLADLASYLGAFDRVPVVIHWHAEIVRQTVWKALYLPPVRRTLAKASRIIVSGETLIDNSPLLRPFRGKCAVVPFGVDYGFWNDLSAEDDAEIARLRIEHPRLVLAVGRLVSYKGFHVLLDAFGRVDGELWIAGVGPLKPFLEARARESGAEERVRFLDDVPVRRLRQLYHAARLLALPSVSAAETFGIVQIEAMSCGLPVVNTAVPTIVPEVARDGREALTVKPEDSALLAEAISYVLDDPDLRRRLGDAARTRARDDFSQADFLSGVEWVYRDALS